MKYLVLLHHCALGHSQASFRTASHSAGRLTPVSRASTARDGRRVRQAASSNLSFCNSLGHSSYMCIQLSVTICTRIHIGRAAAGSERRGGPWWRAGRWVGVGQFAS